MNMRIIDPPHTRIFESWQPFKDFFCRDHQDCIVPDLRHFKSLKKNYDFVIANCSTEHWGSDRASPFVARLHDLLTEHYGQDFVCLCHEPSDENARAGILYFPFYGWRKPWRSLDPALTTNCDRRYLFSNLNYFARDFRIALYLALKKKSYAKRCLLTMHHPVYQDNYNGHLALTYQESHEWQQMRSDLPTEISDGFQKSFDYQHPAFSNSYLHVVSETTINDKIFLTEKTWQTIAAGQLFVIWGNSGIIAHLRDLGVDVFDDILDHDYDSVYDHRSRLQCLQAELDRLSVLDWQKIYKDTTSRRQSNANKFASGAFISQCLDRLRLALPEGVI